MLDEIYEILNERDSFSIFIEIISDELKFINSTQKTIEAPMYRMFVLGIGLLIIIVSLKTSNIFSFIATWMTLILLILYSMFNRFEHRKLVFLRFLLLFDILSKIKPQSELNYLLVIAYVSAFDTKNLYWMIQTLELDKNVLQQRFGKLLNVNTKTASIRGLMTLVAILSIIVVVELWSIINFEQIFSWLSPYFLFPLGILVEFGFMIVTFYLGLHHVRVILLGATKYIMLNKYLVYPHYPILKLATSYKFNANMHTYYTIFLEQMAYSYLRTRDVSNNIRTLSTIEASYIFAVTLKLIININLIIILFAMLSFALYSVPSHINFVKLDLYRELSIANYINSEVTKSKFYILHILQKVEQNSFLRLMYRLLIISISIGHTVVFGLILFRFEEIIAGNILTKALFVLSLVISIFFFIIIKSYRKFVIMELEIWQKLLSQLDQRELPSKILRELRI